MVFRSLLKREVKAIVKNPGFLVALLLIPLFYVSLGSFMNTGIRSVVNQNTGVIGVVDEDNTTLSRAFVAYLNNTLNGRVRLVTGVSELPGFSTIVVVPRGFGSEALNSTPRLVTYTPLGSLSLTSIGSLPPLLLQGSFNEALRYALAALRSNTTINFYSNATVGLDIKIVYEGRVLDYGRVSTDMGFGIASTFVVAILMSFTMGFATQASAVEKAEKAFELLLSQPVRRVYIALAKIVASIVAAVIMGAVLFGSLFVSLFSMSLSSQLTPQAAGVSYPATSQVIDLNTILFMLVTAVLGTLLSGGLGVVIGGLVSDERTAGIIVTPITMVMIGLAIIVQFTGLGLNTPTSVVSGLTVAPMPLLLSLSSTIGDYTYFYVALASSLAEVVAVYVLAFKVYNSEFVVTGLQLRGRVRGRS